jgi:hypothetical protein
MLAIVFVVADKQRVPQGGCNVWEDPTEFAKLITRLTVIKHATWNLTKVGGVFPFSSFPMIPTLCISPTSYVSVVRDVVSKAVGVEDKKGRWESASYGINTNSIPYYTADQLTLAPETFPWQREKTIDLPNGT